jgi:predicted PurR-regulated permease PerM
MDASLVRKYFFSALLVVAIGLGIVLFWPFLKVITLAVVCSVLLHPLFRWIKRRVKVPALSSFLTLICFIVIICIPLYFFGTVLLRQAQNMYQGVVVSGSINTTAHHVSAWLHHLFPTVTFNLQDRVSAVLTSLPSTAGTILTTTVSTIIYFIFMLISMFYFLKDGPEWKESLIELIPLSNDSNRQIVSHLQRSINGIVKGYVVVGLAQGIVTTTGLYLFHVPHAALWGTLAVFVSLIPPLGTAVISISVVTFLLLVDRSGAAIGYAAWAICFSMSIDNILNPYVVGRQIAIHPLLVLFSVIGGLALMGPVGILIGPLIVSFVYALISVYKTEMGHADELLAEETALDTLADPLL